MTKDEEVILSQVDVVLAQRARKWHTACHRAGLLEVMFTCGLRSAAEQDALYGRGRTAEHLIAKGVPPHFARPEASVVTTLYGDRSYHVAGKALDWNAWVLSAKDLKLAAEIARHCGLISGYFWAWRDSCHLQLPG